MVRRIFVIGALFIVVNFKLGPRCASVQAVEVLDVCAQSLSPEASIRFKDANFVTSVLEAVEEVDAIFTQMGLPRHPWRSDADVNSALVFMKCSTS